MAAFRRSRPDVVLCDMMMEDLDAGAQAAKIMRKERPDVPIFLLRLDRRRTAETVGFGHLGFSGIFQKPVNFDLLLAVWRGGSPRAEEPVLTGRGLSL